MNQASYVKWSAVQLPLFNLSYFLLCHIEEASEIGESVDAKFPQLVEPPSVPVVGNGEKPSSELPTPMACNSGERRVVALDDYERCRIDALNISTFRACDEVLREVGLPQEADNILAIFDGYFGNAKKTYEYVAILLADIMRKGVAS